MRNLPLLLSALALPFATGGIAQVPDKPEMAMIAGDKLGEIDFPNSGNAAAQAPFIRGVKLLHNFEYPEALASFREAQKADPDFALALRWPRSAAHMARGTRRTTSSPARSSRSCSRRTSITPASFTT